MSFDTCEYDHVLIDIIDYVYEYEVAQPESFARARLLLLDSFGCAMESSMDASVKALIGPYMQGTTVPQGFCLPGTSIQEDPVKGAFDFGTMIRYLDHNDALSGTEWGHPSDNLGAIVAVMDTLDRSKDASAFGLTGEGTCPPMTIRTLLQAMIKAYEVEGCFQVANSFNAVSIDHTILVKITSTAVIAWLSGLSREQALAALSQAWMDGHPLRTYRAFPNAIPRKGWAAGDACSRAVHLLHMTLRGQPGAPKPLTAKRWGFYDSLFRNKTFQFPIPFREYFIHNTIVKLFACEGHVLTAAEAALQIHRNIVDKGRDPLRDVVRIKVRTQAPAILITDKKGKLTNAADRDHCFQYIVAVILAKGQLIEYDDYQDGSRWANSPDIERLRGVMELHEDADFTREYYDGHIKSVANALSVMLQDGTWMEEVVVHLPIGHARAEGSVPKTVAKYRALLGTRFTEEEISHIEASLERDELPVSEFVGLWKR